MNTRIDKVEISKQVILGAGRPVIIAGPCAIESLDICIRTGEQVKRICEDLSLPYVFKSSFDKANRTSGQNFRSIGSEEALRILETVRNQLQVPVLTDVHETIQVQATAEVVDVLQIPAFLCRQTDLLQAAARSGRAVNIKKGQFMAPEDMEYAVEKVASTGNPRVFLTERGTSFGYHALVVDMRSLPVMRQFSPVVFDVTHSVQMPGGAKGASGGQREFAPYLARAAAAVGVDGFFIETHPNPAEALSDGPNMIPLDEMKAFLSMIVEISDASRKYLP